MLIEFVVSGVLSLVAAVWSLLPACGGGHTEGCLSLPDLSGWGFWYTWLDGWLPLHEGVSLVATSLGVMTVLGTIWIVMWFLRRLPLVGSVGKK